jgi:hypothetical protein
MTSLAGSIRRMAWDLVWRGLLLSYGDCRREGHDVDPVYDDAHAPLKIHPSLACLPALKKKRLVRFKVQERVVTAD